MHRRLKPGESGETAITLVGPPNAGKTTLFNTLTGARYTTANYPGTTVEYQSGKLKTEFGFSAVVTDTPGLSNLIPFSPDQQVTADHLFKKEFSDSLLVVLADATQLDRHLYLADQLIEAGFNALLCLTMTDILDEREEFADLEKLSALMRVPCAAVDGRDEKSVKKLVDKIQMHCPVLSAVPVKRPGEPDSETIHGRFKKIEAAAAQSILKTGAGATGNAFNPDRIFLHPVFGLLIFLAIMGGIFTAIFWMAQPAMDGIDRLFGVLIEGTRNLLPDGWFTELLAGGLVAGFGSVLIFLPQIAILFLAMGYLEDSGYLARGAMLIDRPLSAMGMNGRSFIPLLSGFACAIPAVMATRTISSRRERFLTIFVIPLMTCSARLPVYALLLGFLFPLASPWVGGFALAALYAIGIALGSVAATVIARFKFKTREKGIFQLELPAYRVPQWKVVFSGAYYRSKSYVTKAGAPIVTLSVGLWLLSHLPFQHGPSPGVTASAGDISQSYAAKLGKAMEPVMEPVGLDWRAGVAMIMAFAAREVFVSSLALMYRIEEGSEESVRAGLLQKMKEATFEGTTQPVFTFSSCLGLLFFFAVALQCFSTVAVVRKETGQWALPVAQLLMFTGIAYAGSVLLVQSLRLAGFS